MRRDQGIPEIKVLQTAVNERGEIIITVESTKTGTRCRKCGKQITKAHGQDDGVTIRHLPAFGQQTYLRYRPKRYQCQDCEGQPTTPQTLDWHDANSPRSYEGFNNKVKVLKRRCYGIFNLAHLFQRIDLGLVGYRLFAPTPISG